VPDLIDAVRRQLADWGHPLEPGHRLAGGGHGEGTSHA